MIKRVDPAVSLTAVGGSAIVLGGLVAAVTGPLALTHGSWAAAYLVLVAGVAQWTMGWAREARPGGRPAERWAWLQFSAWNAGNAAVVVGTLVGRPWLVIFAAVLLVVALVIAVFAEFRGPRHATRSQLSRWAYLAMLVVLAVSVPTGVMLLVLRNA